MKSILKTGLVSENNKGYFDMYFDRIMFPLWNLNGQVVGYSGRIYNTNDSSKYINTKETEIFKKGELLYNYHKARDEARMKDTIIVMEGFMDVIRAYSIGIKNVIATMGTAVTKNQALLIKRLAKNVVLCFDGDDAGAKATLSCSEVLESVNVIPKVVRLEDNLDPDEYIIKNGKEKFLNKINNPINLIDFKFKYLRRNRDLSNQIDFSSYINDMLKELVKETDDILIELTLNKLSEESKIDINFLKDKFKSIKNETKNEENKKIVNKKVNDNNKKNKYEIAEENLLYYMLLSNDVIETYIESSTFLPDNNYRLLAREIINFYKEHGKIEQADLLTELEDECKNTLLKIMNLNLKDDYTMEEINDYIKAIYEFNIINQSNVLKIELKNETDPIKKALIAQKLLELKKLNEKKNGDNYD